MAQIESVLPGTVQLGVLRIQKTKTERRALRWLVAMLAIFAVAACDGGDGAGTTDATGGGAVQADGAGGSGAADGSVTDDTSAAPEDGGALADGATESDAGGGSAECVYSSDCNPPTTVCRGGACVPGCLDEPCPEGYQCAEETGFCWQQCLTWEDCDNEGYRCDGQRCTPGCPWHACPLHTECDPVSGNCTESFCQREVESDTDRLWFGQADPASPLSRGFTINVAQYRPLPANIDLQWSEISDIALVQIDQVATLGPGGDPVAVELPYDAQPGQTLSVNISMTPETLAGVYSELEIVTDAMVCANNPIYFIAAGTTTCLSFQPQEIDAGKITWGDVDKRPIRLRNDCDRDITIQRVSFLSAFSDWTPAADYDGTVIAANGGTLDLDVFFAPTIPAIRNTKMFVVTDDAENRILQVTLNGEGAE